MNYSRIVRECPRCLDLLSGCSTSFSLVYFPRYSNIQGNCRTHELARADALLMTSSSIDLDMPLASIKLNIVGKFFRDAKLSWINEESCSTARLTWPLMNGRPTNQLLGFGCYFNLTAGAVLTGNCLTGRHVERMMLPFPRLLPWMQGC